MDWIETVIIAIIEGLTEFLPVSSTGHMLLHRTCWVCLKAIPSYMHLHL